LQSSREIHHHGFKSAWIEAGYAAAAMALPAASLYVHDTEE
jgi:hypothetical protein